MAKRCVKSYATRVLDKNRSPDDISEGKVGYYVNEKAEGEGEEFKV